MLTLKSFTNFLNACKGLRETSGLVHSAAGSFEMLQILDSTVYKPEHFKPWELVPPEIFGAFGDKSLAFLDARILWTADAIREHFNVPAVVNNYNSARPEEYVYSDSGFRLSPVGAATYSQHLYGRALDIKLKGVDAETARIEIKAKWKSEPAFRFITAVELDVSWLHIDCRNTNSEQLLLFSKG